MRQSLFFLTNKSDYRQPELDSHIPALDGLRGVAILLVLLHHAGTVQPNVWFDSVFFQIGRAGWCGVDLFFVLSGFLITNILMASKQSENYFRNFYMRRTLRIFPLYYGILVAFFLLLPWVVRLSDNPGYQWQFSRQGWYWTYTQNWMIALRGSWPDLNYLTHFWTLAIEEQFYLLWPLMVFLMERRRLLTVCLLMMAVALAIRVALVMNGAGWATVFVLTFTRMDALALGGAIALVARSKKGIAPLAQRVPLALFVCVAALLVIILYHGQLYGRDLLTQTVGFTVLAIFFGGVLVAAITFPENSPIVRFFNFPLLRFLGKYSYGIYVFHLPITYLLWTVLKPSDLPTVMGSELLGHSLFFIAVSAVSTVAALLSWHLYENQFLKLKKFFPRC